MDDEKLQKQLDELAEARETVIYPCAGKMGNCKTVLPGGDHGIYEQKPAECGRIVREFMEGSDG